MAEVPKKIQDELPRIKKNIENAYNYFKDNYKYYNEMKKYLFKRQISDNYQKQLNNMGKPSLEFNVIGAFLSKLCGEVANSDPSVKVTSDYTGATDSKTIEVVEGHLRHILCETKKNNTIYKTLRDTTGCGYSVLKIWTEYANPMSMDQVIKLGLAYSPPLTFFDPYARLSHKGDGRYCGEIFPVTKEDFEEENPDIDIDEISYDSKLGEFQWGYNNGKDKVILKCDYYEKKKKRIKIMTLADNRFGKGIVVTDEEYKTMQRDWDNAGFIEPLPAIVGEPRWTEIETICRYKLCAKKILKYEETDYKHFPLIFADGDSEIIQDESGSISQVVRSYVKNAKGMQDLMNFAGNTLAQELANIIQHQYHIFEEAMPTADAYKNVYTDPQHGNILVSKAFADKDQTKSLAPPSIIQRQQIPPQIAETFANAPQTIQVALGAYDASIVNVANPILSGKAIQQGQKQANAASEPYKVNLLEALGRALDCCLALIPKYYITPRTIPVLDEEGNHSFKLINAQDPDSINIKYDDNVLKVQVVAGPSYAMQQDEALNQVVQLSQAMPGFADFFSKKGLKYIIDCLHIHGVEQLKENVEVYQREMAQQQAQIQQQQAQIQQQQAMQAQAAQTQAAQMQMAQKIEMTKLQMAQQKMQLEAQQEETKAQLKATELAVAQEKNEVEKMKAVSQERNTQVEQMVKLDKHDAEKTRAAVDMAVSMAKLRHDTEHEKHRVGNEIANTMLEHKRHSEKLEHEKMSAAHEANESMNERVIENDGPKRGRPKKTK